MSYRLLIVGVSAMLAACAGEPPLQTRTGDSGLLVPQSGVLPPPEGTDLFAQNRPYLIGPFDRLSIDVFGVPELSNKEFQTDAGGRISFPLAGIVDAAGKTPGELEDLIEQRLRGRYIRDPQVTVNLKETVSQVITVDGQVTQPGLYPVIGRMTLMRAIATAKGLNEFAKQTDVVVFRTVGGQKMAALYNLKAIRRGYYDDPEVFANDIVMVGESPGRRLFKDALQVVPILTTPLILLLRN
jgi:polysaccharide export outer membrane protein